MAAAGAKTPRVQLVLHVEGREETEMRQLAVTAGHEVLEVRRNGVPFMFKRRRHAPPPAQPAASAPRTAAKSHLLRTPAGALMAQQAATTAVAAESPYADELELDAPLYQRLGAAAAALPDRAAPAQRLLAFAASVAEAATEADARRPGGQQRAAALAAALQAFQASLAGALERGDVALAAPAPRAPPTPCTEGEVEQPDYAVDLAARKAGLRARLANFQKEEAEWHALLEKVQALDQDELAPAAASDAAAAAAAADGQPAAAAAAAAGGSSALPSAAQQEQLQQQQQEQQPGSSGSEDAELAALTAAAAGLHRRLAMQVEGVCKLVGDVEEMVERANRSAAAVQAEYHAEKFRVFPHVDSPARLIRELVRPAAAAAAGGAAASGGKAAAAQAAAAAAAGDKENAGAMEA